MNLSSNQFRIFVSIISAGLFIYNRFLPSLSSVKPFFMNLIPAKDRPQLFFISAVLYIWALIALGYSWHANKKGMKNVFIRMNIVALVFTVLAIIIRPIYHLFEYTPVFDSSFQNQIYEVAFKISQYLPIFLLPSIGQYIFAQHKEETATSRWTFKVIAWAIACILGVVAYILSVN